MRQKKKVWSGRREHGYAGGDGVAADGGGRAGDPVGQLCGGGKQPHGLLHEQVQPFQLQITSKIALSATTNKVELLWIGKTKRTSLMAARVGRMPPGSFSSISRTTLASSSGYVALHLGSQMELMVRVGPSLPLPLPLGVRSGVNVQHEEHERDRVGRGL